MKRNIPSHTTAKSSHYDEQATDYDAFNEQNSKVINQTIEKILKKYKIKTVLDLACGTGSQVFWLLKCGHEVCGADINANMLKVARMKARTEKKAVKFIKGDMRSLKVGKFDAVVTIFNAVGHLTKLDFEKAMGNINKNLKKGGIYIFDINNLNYLLKDNNITALTIDWQIRKGNTKTRAIQYSTIVKDGILTSYTTCYEHNGASKPKITREAQTLQVYSVKQLKEMLKKHGFKVLGQYDVDGSKFIESKTERILMVVRKQ